MQPLALFFADHHAGGGYPGRGIDDSAYSLKQIIDHAIHSSVPWVWSLGDAVDSLRCHADGPIPMRNQLLRLLPEGIKFGFIDGNHDKSSKGVSWLESQDFHHLDMETIDVGGFFFMGIDWRPREKLLHLLTNDFPTDITGLLMHQGWGEFLRWEGSSQISFSEIPAPVTRLLTGDFHGESLTRKYRGRDGQNILVANPGSTSVQDIAEPEDKFFGIFYDDGSISYVPLDTRRVIRSDVLHTKEDFDEFLSSLRDRLDKAYAAAVGLELPDEMCKPLLQVTYSSTLPDVTRRVEKVVQGQAHLFWKELHPEVSEKDSKVSVSLSGRQGVAFTPVDLLSQAVDPDNPDDKHAKEVHALCEQLVYTKDKKQLDATFQKWWHENLGE